jgi:hypothetical protein
MTRFSTILGILALALASLLTVPAPARSDTIYFNGDTYAAIAYSPETGKWGYAYNCGSRGQAERMALSNCPQSDARIVCWVHNGFCALALGDDKASWGTGWSYGDGATNTAARNYAMTNCKARTTGARIVLCVCSTNVRPEVNQ